MHGRYVALSAIALFVGLGGGVALERFYMATPSAEEAGGGPEILYWVAPMDPNFRRDAPGKSPMGMDLVPVYRGEEPGGDLAEVRLSAAEINAIGVRTAISRVEPIARRIETIGFVSYDEHATSHIHMRVEGWIDRLNTRAEGDGVKEGDLLFELYAPEITVASSELLRAERRQDANEIAIAERKLSNFGVSPRQIEEMARASEPAEHIRVYAPQDGVVTDLTAADGMYLKPETRAMSLSNLSTVWLVVDVFERDLARLTENMTAEARFDHLPGRTFTGEIDYVYPELDVKTRTLPVRLRLENVEGVLRPNMFGSVALIPTETRDVVTVPSEAVIRTGRAERVILKAGDGVFRPRLVTTGLRDGFGQGGRTEIVQGLGPGEEIVASAQFLIDSESALSAGLTRIAPTEAEPARGAGVLLSLDREARRASVRHDAIADLDWPAMGTMFALGAGVRFERLEVGGRVKFAAARGVDGLLALVELEPDDGVEAVGRGVIHSVTQAGQLNLSHEPIPELAWPAMTMDMLVDGFDANSAPIEQPVEFDLAKGADGLFVVTAVRALGDDADPSAEDAVEAALTGAPRIVVEGEIQAVDANSRAARVAHGPIPELGMPGMTMEFALAADVDPNALPVGARARLTLERAGGMTLILAKAELIAAPMRVRGTVNSVDPEARMANVTHGPINDLGMPGMTMDFALGGTVDPYALPVGRTLVLLLEKGTDRSLTVVGYDTEPTQ